MKISRKAFLSAAASLLVLGAAHAQAPKELNFGIISTDSSSALKSLWQPFLDDLSKATGMKVNGFFATDYTGIIEGMRFGKVQVAWHGNKSAIEAVDRAGGDDAGLIEVAIVGGQFAAQTTGQVAAEVAAAVA